MSPIAQCLRVSATIGKQWLQNVAADVLNLVESSTMQLGGRYLINGFHQIYKFDAFKNRDELFRV